MRHESHAESVTATQEREDARKFRYEAETLNGDAVKGRIEAPSVNHARNELAVQGLRVSKISERKGVNVEITKEKVPLVEVMHFSRQMATFLRAGVPMTEALETSAGRRRTSGSRRSSATSRARHGRPTRSPRALNRHADVFPSYFVAMLGSAELTGQMDEAFEQLHNYIRRDLELGRAVRKALIYPVILLMVAAAGRAPSSSSSRSLASPSSSRSFDAELPCRRGC